MVFFRDCSRDECCDDGLLQCQNVACPTELTILYSSEINQSPANIISLHKRLRNHQCACSIEAAKLHDLARGHLHHAADSLNICTVRLSESQHSCQCNSNLHYPFEMLETATAKVYSELIPSHPGNGWTRFVCISDNHSRKFSVPPGDVLLHAGDLSSWGEFSHLKKTIDWLKSLDHPTKMYLMVDSSCQMSRF